MSLSVSRGLAENYANYYERDAGLSEWRRLGAIDKCANIVRLCSGYERREVLEIGCGDGAILERLALTGFGARFTGLEISASAVRAVQEKNIPGASVGGASYLIKESLLRISPKLAAATFTYHYALVYAKAA